MVEAVAEKMIKAGVGPKTPMALVDRASLPEMQARNACVLKGSTACPGGGWHVGDASGPGGRAHGPAGACADPHGRFGLWT